MVLNKILIFFFVFVGWADSAYCQILLPQDPTPVAPPTLKEEDYNRDIERKRKRRQKRESKDDAKKALKRQFDREKELIDDTVKPRLRHIMLEISLITPSAQTSGDRQGYTSDLTTHFNVMWRKDPKNMNGKRGLWYGLRLAPFAGSGIYKEFHGNYGFTYFGPMIGIGMLEPMPAEPEGAKRGNKLKPPQISGWLISGGIAAQHRLSGADASDESSVDDDFDENIGYDAPGIWTEFRYMRVIWGAIATNYLVGIQSGKQKLFVYAGIGFGGWH